MTRSQKHLARIATLTAGFLPSLALAHHGSGEAASFAAGVMHPLGGIEHIGGFIIVGVLAARLGGRYLAPLAAVLLGLSVAAWTDGSDGWRYAAGFMVSGAGLIAAALIATRIATTSLRARLTANAPRSPI